MKCFYCGEKSAEKISCNSCRNKIAVCEECKELFLITVSECVCPDCQNAGQGGEGRRFSSRTKNKKRR